MYVLGIESSCDETGVAIYHPAKGLVANVLHSQIEMHQQFGGVVPELASRDHLQYVVKLVDTALQEASLSKTDLDLIAYTAGPGLIGALLTGACFAKSFAFGLGIPALAVHHLEAHILAAMLETPSIAFPFLALLISGGHTQLIAAKALGEYDVIGESLDDALGEAFDKTARLMGLPYPGGPLLAALADEAAHTLGLPTLLPFPRPMIDRPNLNFSFSGLKTHAMTTWRESAQDRLAQLAIAKAFQDAIIETVTVKCSKAIKQYQIKRLIVAGGVSANVSLRAALRKSISALDATVYFPSPTFCTDNGAMVAYAGYLHFNQNKHQDNSLAIDVRARWPFKSTP